MTEAPRRASEVSSPERDALGAALPGHPYFAVAEVLPDMPVSRINQVMQALQRRKLRAPERAAWRLLRDLPVRLAWDARLLGTMPEVSDQEWLETYDLLARQERTEAHARWTEALRRAPEGPALHVCAALALAEIAHQASTRGRVAGADLRRGIALWAALLHADARLRSFALHRCRIWGLAPPAEEVHGAFRERLEQEVQETLRSAAGASEQRGAGWAHRWETERTAITIAQTALGARREPAWPAGFGPEGLALLGRDQEARRWALATSRPYRGGLALTAVKQRGCRLTTGDAQAAATAATALQLSFSSLGSVAAHVWNGDGRAARRELGRRTRALRHAARPESDPWFGEGAAAAIRLERALLELQAEARLRVLHDKLTVPTVKARDVSETVDGLLRLTDSLPQPFVVVDELERLLCGRLSACQGDPRPVPAAELRRLDEVVSEAIPLLRTRGAGQQCSLSLALVLTARAVRRWNRAARTRSAERLARPAALRDLFRAVELAPHHANIVTNLGRLVINVQRLMESEPERRGLLEMTFQALENCIQLGSVDAEVRELRGMIQELLDPAAALVDATRELEKALGLDPRKASRPDDGTELRNP